MAVSGKRAGVEFQQTLQSLLINAADSVLPFLIIGPFYQIIEALSGDSANPDAVVKDADGLDVLYEGQEIDILFYTDQVNLTGVQAIPSLIPNSLILPNERSAGAFDSDVFFKVFLNPPGTDEFVELTLGDHFDLITSSSGPNVGATVGLKIFSGMTDALGNPFTVAKRANIVVGLRALRRDFSRKALKTDSSNFLTIAGDTYGPENPAAFALQKAFEIAPNSFAYLIAVDEVTTAEPEGTFGAYIRALGIAETLDIYSLVVLTRDQSVLNAVTSHVLNLSRPEGRRERIALVTRDLPTLGPDNILLSGVGNLDLVRASVQVSGTNYGYVAESVKGGAAFNGNIEYEVINTGAGGLSIQRVGQKQLVSATDGNVEAGTYVLNSDGVDFSSSGVNVNVGDLLEYNFSGTTLSTEGVIASDRFQDSNVNFRDIGVKIGDKLVISSGSFSGTYTIKNLVTTDNLYDTLILDAAFGGPAPAATSYEILLTLRINQIVTSNSVKIDAQFGVTSSGTLPFRVLSSTVKEILVDLGQVTPNTDSSTLVAFLNSNPAVRSIATFYVSPNALVGTPVSTFARSQFLGGLNSYTQFFTNSDINSIALPAIPGSPTGSEKDVFIDMESENHNFLVVGLRKYNGSVILSETKVLRKGVAVTIASGELPSLKTTESFSLFSVGNSLIINTPFGVEPDKEAQVNSLVQFPKKFSSRRIRALWPDVAITTVNGVQVTVPSYYMCASLAAQIATLPSEQGYSELPLPGWNSIRNSNDYFSEKQLETLTASGMFVYVQDEEGGPIVCRKQYTTDVSGDLTAEASFTHIADEFAKVVRRSSQPLQGRNNLTEEIIDRERMIIQAAIKRFQNRQAIKTGTLNSLTPSKEPGDKTTLIGDVTLEFYGPYNLLRIKLNLL